MAEDGHVPVWVRRRDGSQVPFEADRICQSLYAAAEALGAASAFLVRELTDVVLHFLAREDFDGAPSTAQIAEHVEKIVREAGQPALARRYAELQRRGGEDSGPKRIALAWPNSLEQLESDCRRAYALRAVFTRDVAAAVQEGLLHLDDLDAPATLASAVVDAARLTELPWWPALDDWRAAAGRRWIVDSPESLCTPRMHPALTPHLCERLLALPTFAQRDVELHLNCLAGGGHQESPLFAADADDSSRQEQSNFLDGLLERWKVLSATRLPALAWHLHEDSFHEEAQHRQLRDLLRQAVLGKPIRFVFDRPRSPVALGEGLDRKCPGVLLEVGLDLAALAARPEIQGDAATLLKKLPSLARLAVSAARQKRHYLRSLSETSPLKRQFLIERSAAFVNPLGLDQTVRNLTGEGLAHSPLALDFALRILHTLRATLDDAGRSVLLELRLDGPALSAADWTIAPQKQLEIAGKLHARAGSGTMALVIADEVQANIERLADLLQWAWAATSVVRVQIQRAGGTLQQGELPIEN